MNRSQAIRMKKRTIQYKIHRVNLLKELINKLIILLIIIALFLFFRWVTITEYGSFKGWWLSGNKELLE